MINRNKDLEEGQNSRKRYSDSSTEPISSHNLKTLKETVTVNSPQPSRAIYKQQFNSSLENICNIDMLMDKSTKEIVIQTRIGHSFLSVNSQEREEHEDYAYIDMNKKSDRNTEQQYSQCVFSSRGKKVHSYENLLGTTEKYCANIPQKSKNDSKENIYASIEDIQVIRNNMPPRNNSISLSNRQRKVSDHELQSDTNNQSHDNINCCGIYSLLKKITHSKFIFRTK